MQELSTSLTSKLILLVSTFSVLLLANVTVATPNVTSCRCLPQESCWPTQQDWFSFNRSIQGNLVAVRPVADVCYRAEFDKEACQKITASWSYPRLSLVRYNGRIGKLGRNGMRGAIMRLRTQHAAREASHYTRQSRDCISNPGHNSFAEAHNIRLVIRNSGHDFLGRSLAPESLQIFTGTFQNSSGEGPAVTVAAGVSVSALYDAVSEQKQTVIAGAARTIGVASGCIQGGGHFVFGPWKGLAADNALEFEAVLANGILLYANEYQNYDLFWALRGGGGGTFGVVVSVTVHTFPEVPVVVTNLNITTALGSSPNFWDALAGFHRALPWFNDANSGGYYLDWPKYSRNATTDISMISVFLVFASTSDTVKADRVYSSLISKLNQVPGITTQYKSFVSPGINSTMPAVLSQSIGTGGIGLMMSRLFSKDLLISGNSPEGLTRALRNLRYSSDEPITGVVVAGGTAASTFTPASQSSPKKASKISGDSCAVITSRRIYSLKPTNGGGDVTHGPSEMSST
ncbi:hypothetical protein N7481_001343 [Penicillium waksmanii]|uniref:uncharacterized protein n=1 Tax=Penicillium waksmanii TaxID=69791 RepID=UPI002546E62C|nr:uncharacterized protein N7481_001343 [Penicillium waksmanii]KAJ6000934.1 hypothetical protein N7481_001343 [Penicillium waksmanii]